MSSVVSDLEQRRFPPALAQYLAPISQFLAGDITEVCVNRPGELWTETFQGWEKHQVPELTYARMDQLATLVANFNNDRVGRDKPFLSGTLPNRERVQIVVPPATTEGTVSITIRKPSMVDKTLEELEAEGSFSDAREATDGLSDVDRELLDLRRRGLIRQFLELAVVSRKNILLGGATGSGKTTVMKSLAKCIPHSERVITIEDAHELFMADHPNKVHLFYRSGKEDGPQSTSQECLRSCMRMKPDRILLAELRGTEVWDYMDSLNSGHPGSLSSLHCNSALDAFNRLTSLIKMSDGGMNLAPEYIQQMCLENIDIVLFYKRRRLQEIYFDPERRNASSRVREAVT